MTTAVMMGRDDFRTLRNVLRFADAGVMPATDVAHRAAMMLDDFRVSANLAVTAIETIRSGVLPSQEMCQAAQVEILRLYEDGERDVEAPAANWN